MYPQTLRKVTQVARAVTVTQVPELPVHTGEMEAITEAQDLHRAKLTMKQSKRTRLRTNIKTIRGLEIIGKTERKLLNERIRSINNSLELYMYERSSIVHQLEERLGQSNIVKECQDFINRVIECRHQRVMTRQKRKFELLCQQKTGGCSNKEDHVDSVFAQTSDTNTNSSHSKWVINLSDTPLTKAQTRLLAHGPNFAIIPRHPPKEEYVASIEYAC